MARSGTGSLDLLTGTGHPPAQRLAQLRRVETGPHADTVVAALTLVDLLTQPGGLARLEPLIPHLPLSVLLAHLRSLDAAGIGFETAMAIAARIADPAEVRASGLGPLRFAAAWQGVDSRRWEPALAAGARHSLGAVPRPAGRTLVVIEPGSDTRIVPGGGRFPLDPDESPLHALIRWHSGEPRAAGGTARTNTSRTSRPARGACSSAGSAMPPSGSSPGGRSSSETTKADTEFVGRDELRWRRRA